MSNSNLERSSSSSTTPTISVFEMDPLLKDLNDKGLRLRRKVMSFQAELQELRSRVASQEQSLAKETLARQEAETKAKSLEEEIGKLQKILEERNKQLQASTSTTEKIKEKKSLNHGGGRRRWCACW